MPRITVKGPAGAVVRIVPSELVKPDGRLDDTMCGGKTCWTYTLKGAGTETWFPKFFYRGARYLRVDCLPPKGKTNLPVVKSIAGVVVQSASEPVGEFPVFRRPVQSHSCARSLGATRQHDEPDD